MDQPVANVFLPQTKVRPATIQDLYITLRSWASQVVNAQFSGIGATLDSNQGSLTITNTIHHVSGTGQVKKLVPPPNATGPVTLISDNGFSLVPGGNIAGLSGVTTIPQGTSFVLNFDNSDAPTGQQWFPVSASSVTNGVIPKVTYASDVFSVTAARTTFTLAATPTTGSARVYRNGVRQALNLDYTISGNVVTFTAVSSPQAGDTVVVDYVH